MGKVYDALREAKPGDILQVPSPFGFDDEDADFKVSKNESKPDGAMLNGTLHYHGIKIGQIAIRLSKGGVAIHKL